MVRRANRLLLAASVSAAPVALVMLLASASPVSAATLGSSRPDGTFVPAPLPTNPTPTFGPMATAGIKVEGSLNWSGYVQSAKTHIFTAVQDTWTVPTVSTAPSGDQYSSDWVGIGGFTPGDDTLVQAGTEGDNLNGTAQYYAWTELISAPQVPLTMTVSPGDSITTVVKETATNVWLMQVTDNTTHVTQSRTATYPSSGLSAEAIHEATDVNGTFGPLATTTNVTFDPGSFTSTFQTSFQPLLVPAIQSEKTTKKGTKIKPDKVYEIEMFTQAKPHTQIATPSAPDSDLDGFTVAYGSVAPSPPAS
jgi:hypothetical protein